MRVRADVVAMLRAGATYDEIRQQVPGISNNTITATRRALHIPVPQRPRPTRTPEESCALYTTPVGNGHAHWTGPWAGRMPQICHPGKHGRKESALRVAFRMRHGRDPIGYVRPVCDDPDCCASAHLADRPMRQHLDNILKAVFGNPPTTQNGTP